MNTKSRIIVAALAVSFSVAAAHRAHACGRYGPPPMSQTMLAALSDDPRAAAWAVEKLRQQGPEAIKQVKAQLRWQPMTIQRLDYTITHFEKLASDDNTKLTDEQRASYRLRLTKLRLKRFEAKLRSHQLATLLKRLEWAIARSTVMA